MAKSFCDDPKRMSEIVQFIMKAIEEAQGELGCGDIDIAIGLAGAIATMDDGARAVFRSTFDLIEKNVTELVRNKGN